MQIISTQKIFEIKNINKMNFWFNLFIIYLVFNKEIKAIKNQPSKYF